MRSYEAARRMYNFLGAMSRVVIAVGIVVAVVLASSAETLLATVPGAAIALVGLYCLIIVQNGRTSVDCAEYAQQALGVSRKQLELSRQMLEQGRESAASYAQLINRLAPARASSEPAADGPSYADRTNATATAPATDAPQLSAAPEPKPVGVEQATPLTITHRQGQYFVGDQRFDTKVAALAYLTDHEDA